MSLLLPLAAKTHRPGPTYLDSLTPSPKAVYSLHKLISTATVALRVRRSSDSAELDIGFSGPSLDVSSLLAFVGSGSGYVAKLYDQTSGGKDATQGTAANQPRIVNAGVFDRKLVFNGSSNSLKITSLANGTPYFACYARVKQSDAATAKIIIEASANFNTASQGFLFFAGPDGTGNGMWSMNASNAAGSQRALQFHPISIDQIATVSALWDRTLTGTDEEKLFVDGARLKNPVSALSVEQTGNFGTFDVFVGARGGASLFADMNLETLVLYASDTLNRRRDIEAAVGYGDYYWAGRMNAPTTVTKIGSTYWLVDCWHSRVMYSDDLFKPATKWAMLDDTLQGPHGVATDGYLYVFENTENDGIRTYKPDGAGGFTVIQSMGSLGAGSLGRRTHRTQYDSASTSFYVLGGLSQTLARLTRSGDTLTLQSKVTLSFLGGQYSRGFRIYDGKMYFVAEPGRVFEVSFDGVSTYTLLNTYNTPAGFSSPNDIFRASTGKWYLTATDQGIIRFDSLAAMHAGTFENVYSKFGLAGTPYYLDEFDGALWVPEIIQRNGLSRVINDVPTLVHNYATENASDLARHNTWVQ